MQFATMIYALPTHKHVLICVLFEICGDFIFCVGNIAYVKWGFSYPVDIPKRNTLSHMLVHICWFMPRTAACKNRELSVTSSRKEPRCAYTVTANKFVYEELTNNHFKNKCSWFTLNCHATSRQWKINTSKFMHSSAIWGFTSQQNININRTRHSNAFSSHAHQHKYRYTHNTQKHKRNDIRKWELF